MKHLILIPLLVALTATAPAWGAELPSADDRRALRTAEQAAEDPALKEIVPDGVSPKPEQRALLVDMAPHTHLTLAAYDEQGNVAYLWLSNHGMFTPEGVEKGERAGIPDALMLRLPELPELRRLGLHKQEPLSDSSFRVLQAFPELEEFFIEGHAQDEDSSHRFMQYLDATPNLRLLHLKHLFSLDDTMVGDLNGFPKLEVLELDNASAGPEAVGFLKRCPNVRDLELHRSKISNEGIGEIIDALPKLEVLELKRGGGFDHRCLVHLQRAPRLREVGLTQWKAKHLVWEDGLEHLPSIDTLETLDFAGVRITREDPRIQKLKAARPDLEFVRIK